MPTIRVSIQVSMDDVPLANFPLFQRSAPASVQNVSTPQVSGGGFVAIPSTAMAAIQTAIFQTDQQLSVAFNGVTATPITVTAGGVMVLAGTSLTALSASNSSGLTANIRGLLAGV